MRTNLPFYPFLVILACFIGGVLLPIGAQAQTIPSPYSFIEGRHTIGIIGGPFFMGRGELRLGPGNGTAIGGTYGLEVKGPFAAEVNVLAIRADREVYRPTSSQTIEYLGDVTSSLIGAEVRLRFSIPGPRTWHGISPYIVGGGGMVVSTGGRSSLEADFNDAQYLDFERKGVWSAGAGTRWYPTPSIGIRAEATYRTWTIEVPTAFSIIVLPSGVTPLGEQRVGGVSLTLGATFGL
jgi:hypothetical protein